MKLSREAKANGERLEFIQGLAAAGVVSYQEKNFQVSILPGCKGGEKEESESTTPVPTPDPAPVSDVIESVPGEEPETGDDAAESDTMVTDPTKFEQDAIDAHLND